MKKSLVIVLLLNVVFATAQTDEEKLTSALKEFHQSLVKKNTVSINQQTDKALSYGHSNGWVETKTDMIKNLETGYTSYKSIKEDSLQVTINGNVANVRFVGDYEVSLNGANTVVYHLKVLEVWVRKGKRWLLFARQAVKALATELNNNLRDGFYRIYEDKSVNQLPKIYDKRENKFYLIDSFPSVEIERIKESTIEKSREQGKSGIINLVLDNLGTVKFRQLTGEMTGNKLGFVLENELVFTATLFGPIPDGKISVASDKSNEELQVLIEKIKKRINKHD